MELVFCIKSDKVHYNVEILHHHQQLLPVTSLPQHAVEVHAERPSVLNHMHKFSPMLCFVK
jgi:hypothetical protein